MKQSDDPKFDSIAAWPHDLLVKFAQECYENNKRLMETNDQLRLDLKDAMAQLRKYVDDWK